MCRGSPDFGWGGVGELCYLGFWWTLTGPLQSPQDFPTPHSILFSPAAQVCWMVGWLHPASGPWLCAGSPPASSRSWPPCRPISFLMFSPSTSSIPENRNAEVSFRLNTHLLNTHRAPRPVQVWRYLSVRQSVGPLEVPVLAVVNR